LSQVKPIEDVLDIFGILLSCFQLCSWQVHLTLEDIKLLNFVRFFNEF